MFKRRAQSASKNVRRPGQALEDTSHVDTDKHTDNGIDTAESTAGIHGISEADVDSTDDGDDTTAVSKPIKRQRQHIEQHSTHTAAKAVAANPAATTATLTDPTLVSITSNRSAQPDTSTHSHQHTRFAPKQPPTATNTADPTPATAGTLSLPSTQPVASARFGPQRANGYARSISRIDYQPDICKDWKECGSCGYGDSCKFLHDRLDYKAGWQLDNDWQAEQDKKEAQRKDEAERRARGETVEAGSGGKVGLPFACYICRKRFEQPVVTVCGHYFCERCALQRYVKSSRCAVCGKETQGSFSVARDLLKETAQASDANEGSDEDGLG